MCQVYESQVIVSLFIERDRLTKVDVNKTGFFQNLINISPCESTWIFGRITDGVAEIDSLYPACQSSSALEFIEIVDFHIVYGKPQDKTDNPLKFCIKLSTVFREEEVRGSKSILEVETVIFQSIFD